MSELEQPNRKMIDTLVERLLAWERVFPCDESKPEGSLYVEAADRIKELEAKLLKYEGASVNSEDPQIKNNLANKMWADIFEEMSQKGDALLDLYDSVCIVRLRQVVKWSLSGGQMVARGNVGNQGPCGDYGCNVGRLCGA